MNDCDVVVIGAGLAGAAAAAQLSRAGLNVVILEARARVGGRAYSRPFTSETNDADGQEVLEFGGAWITPWHARVRDLVVKSGLSLRPRAPVTKRQWYRDGRLRGSGPTSMEDRRQHERAIAQVAFDAGIYKHAADSRVGVGPLGDMSFTEYLDGLAAPRSTRSLFSAWWSVSGNGDPATTLATEFLSSCAYGAGLAEGMIDCWADTVQPGMSVLAERLISNSKSQLHLNAQVSAITRSNSCVYVQTLQGARISCRAAVLALGINQLKGLRVEPGLSPAKVSAVELGHAGRAFKVWIKVRRVAVGTLITGNGAGLEWAFAERLAADGTTMIVGFGTTNDSTHPDDPQWVRAEVARLLPKATFLGHDWHDWVTDPYARGTWVANKVGGATALNSENWYEEDALFFASSDFASVHTGWFEGAVVSGEAAAAAILAKVPARCT